MGFFIGKHAAGQLPADEDHLRIIQLARVSTDNINAHSGKETRIGRHGIGLETAFIGKPSRIAPPIVGDGNTSPPRQAGFRQWYQPPVQELYAKDDTRCCNTILF